MIDVKVFNILVHYGNKDEKNFIDLMEDGLLDFLKEGPTKGETNPANVKDIRIKESDDSRLLLTGYFHRASQLEWNFVPKSDFTAISEHGAQQVMPQARFGIDLLEHKLLWITERGITHRPHPANFESYLKYGILPILRKKYSELANTLYEEEYDETPRSERPKIGEYRQAFLQQMKLSRSDFKLKFVPLIADTEIEIYFKEKKYRINRVKFTPHISNPTNDELADMFVDLAKFGSEAGGKVGLDLTAADKEKGVNKAVVNGVIEKNKTKQLIDLKMVVQDKEHLNEKPITVTNKIDDTGKNESTDISLRFEFNLSIGDGTVIGRTVERLEELGLMDIKSAKANLINRFKSLIGK